MITLSQHCFCKT